MILMADNSFSPYVVGGSVRDYIMGAVPHDYDITVSALPEDVIIAKINVDNTPELSAEYNITTLPTLILFKDGKACSRHGMLSKAAIIKLFA